MDMSDSEKWVNLGAGPRQIKDLQTAISHLIREGQTHTEVTGVVGGAEHRSTYWRPIGRSTRPEVVALSAGIREQFGGKITRKNIREIIAAYEAALPEAVKSRPVQDNRRSQAEDAELKAIVAEREAGYQAKRDAETAVLGQVMAKAPAGAKALIVAELHEDTSDTMTDYFANKTVRTVAIGWRFSSREDFRALRAAAASFPGTAGLDLEERRDNYSMGKGNYLSDHGWDGAGSGWVVKSVTLPARWVNLTEDAIPEAGPAPEAAASSADGSITVSEGHRPGYVEIRFADKPSFEVRQGLKAHAFRWSGRNGCWYGRDVLYAEQLAGTCPDCGCDKA